MIACSSSQESARACFPSLLASARQGWIPFALQGSPSSVPEASPSCCSVSSASLTSLQSLPFSGLGFAQASRQACPLPSLQVCLEASPQT